MGSGMYPLASVPGRRACPELPARFDVRRSNGREPSRTAPGLVTLPPDTSYVRVVDNEGNVFSATPSDGFSNSPS